MKYSYSLVFAFFLSFMLQTPAHAEDSKVQAAPVAEVKDEVDSESRAILESLVVINTLLSDISTLDTKLNTLVGDEQKAAIIKRREKSGELITVLKQFGKQARGFGGGQEKLNELLKEDRDNLLKTGAFLRRDIEIYLGQLEKNNKDRDTLTAEGLKSYLNDNKLVDVSFSLLSQYIKIIQSINFNPDPSISFLKASLPKRAEFLSGQIALSNERLEDIAKSLKIDKDDNDAKSRVALTQEKLDAEIKSLKQVIDLSKPFQIDMKQYQTLLVKTTGEISTETLDSEVITVLVKDWWLKSKFAIQENTVTFLIKAFVFVIIIIAFRYLAAFASRVIERSLNSARVKASVLLKSMLVSIVSKVILLMGVLVALSQLGISLAPILAGLGVVGFIVGFALQDTLGNFAAGVMILFYRPYDVGDAVEVGGVAGKVKHMSIVNTTILTFDNQTLILPNSKIWGDVIKNITAQKMRRVDMTFGIGYDDEIQKAEKVLSDIVHAHEKVLDEPEAVIRLHTLGESSVDFIVRPWVKTEDYWNVYWDITREVKMRFDAEGISIPYPQRDVHLHQ